MFRKLLAATALTSVLLLAPSCASESDNADRQEAQQTKASATPQKASPPAHGTADRGKLLQEAVTALQETQNALTAIDQNRRDEAIAALERATGKLEILLARAPTLALAPVEVTTVTYDLLGEVKDVEELHEKAEKAIDDGRLQDARRLIGGLASETVVRTSNLPLATYPDAIKSAAALLGQGKPQDAKRMLEAALNTIIVQEHVSPLPLVRAEAAIQQARSLSEKPARSEAENARLRSLLATAREQVRFGRALGYATKKDMDRLLEAIDEIEENTSGQKHGKGLLDRIQGLFKEAGDASQPPTKSA